jgi:hypothetical protein
MNFIHTRITPSLYALANEKGFRLELTPDGYIEVWPPEGRMISPAAHSRVCDNVADARAAILETQHVPHCLENCADCFNEDGSPIEDVTAVE